MLGIIAMIAQMVRGSQMNFWTKNCVLLPFSCTSQWNSYKKVLRIYKIRPYLFQNLHLIVFRSSNEVTSCLFLCLSIFPFCEKDLGQYWHTYSLTPTCTLRWTTKFWDFLNTLPHSGNLQAYTTIGSDSFSVIPIS